MYDITKLKTPGDCETVMARAKERGLDDVYRDVFRRYCELVGREHEDPADPVVREMWEGIAAYEIHLREKHGGKNIRASRTRQKLANKGVYQSLIDWTKAANVTEGFTALVAMGMPELTGEYIVVKYAERFPPEIVETARQRLEEHGVHPPQ